MLPTTPRIDLTGQRFRSLTVVSPTPEKKGKNKEQWWVCRCDCGETCVRRSSKLRSGEAKSCGCDRNFGHNRRIDREAGLKRRLHSQREANAKKRSIPFALSVDEVWEVVSRPCHYCDRTGVSEIKEARNRHGGLITAATLRHNGIDRIDSNQGYVPGNIVACCKHCNFAKNDMTVEQFREFIDLLYRKFVKHE